MSFFQSKRRKIADYLSGKSELDAFDMLLGDHLNGILADRLAGCGVSEIDVHVDLLDDVKCIGVQGEIGGVRLDLQIEEGAFSIAVDSDEPDDHSEYPLTGADDFYRKVEDILRNIAN